MKTLRMIGMALFAVLMCVNFVACGSSDNEPGIDNVNIEGRWFVSYEEWYDYKLDGTPDMSYITYSEKYEYHEGDIWIFTQKGNGMYTLDRGDEVTLETIKKNTFKKGNDLFTIIKLSDKEMVIEWRDNYFTCFDASGKLIKNDEYHIGELEFGYYTLVR